MLSTMYVKEKHFNTDFFQFSCDRLMGGNNFETNLLNGSKIG